MILRKVNRLSAGMTIRVEGKVWTVESMRGAPHPSHRVILSLFDGEPGAPPVEIHNLFPDDLVEIWTS